MNFSLLKCSSGPCGWNIFLMALERGGANSNLQHPVCWNSLLHLLGVLLRLQAFDQLRDYPNWYRSLSVFLKHWNLGYYLSTNSFTSWNQWKFGIEISTTLFRVHIKKTHIRLWIRVSGWVCSVYRGQHSRLKHLLRVETHWSETLYIMKFSTF